MNDNRLLLLWVWALILTGHLGCSSNTAPSGNRDQTLGTASESQAESSVNLVDVHESRRVIWQHDPGEFDGYEMPSIMGSGGGFVDFNLDGVVDLYLVNGGPINSPTDPAANHRDDGLFRQRSDGTFQNDRVTARITPSGFGMGAWWGDYNQDGFPDVFLTNYGPNLLYQNLGDGTFQRVSLPEGVAQHAWSTAASWVDANGDGWLDLFVVNYVDYVPGQYCEGADGKRDFCGPSTYSGTVDRLLINQGDGGDEQTGPLVDKTLEVGLGELRGKGLGTVTQDFNGDGRVDFYVANDMEPNRLWIQQPDHTFQDQGNLLGVARNFLGQSEASMGVVSRDWNADGIPDLFMTHLTGETNTLYLSDAGGYWVDSTAAWKVGPPSLPDTSFGIAPADLDLNGTIDLLIGNGGVRRITSTQTSSDPLQSYVQRNRAFLLAPGAKSFTTSASLGADFITPLEITRAVAMSDIDVDGDIDFLVTNCAGPVRLYESKAPVAGHWLELRLIDTVGNREATGAQVRIISETPFPSLIVNPYQGYLTQNDNWLHWGLGPTDDVDSIEVRWTDGTQETFPVKTVDQRLTLIRGGRSIPWVSNLATPQPLTRGESP